MKQILLTALAVLALAIALVACTDPVSTHNDDDRPRTSGQTRSRPPQR